MFATTVFLCLLAPAPGQWTLNSGTNASFVFVQPSSRLAWRPNGEPVSYSSLPRPVSAVWSSKEVNPILVVLTNSTKSTVPPAVRFKLPSTSELDATFSSVCSPKRIWMNGFRPVEAQPNMQDIAVGVADGPWKTVNWVDYQKFGNGIHAVKQHGIPVRLSVVGTSPKRTAQSATLLNVPVLHGFDNVSVRFVVRTEGNHEMPFTGSFPSPDTSGVKVFAFDGDVKSVTRVEVQTCPFEWHTLRVAHFKPNAH